jgi:hypothetical protein
MAKWMVLPVIAILLTGCVSTATKTIDAQTASAVRNQSVARTARNMPDFVEMTPAKAMVGVIGAVMMTTEGNKTVLMNKIADPADAVAESLLHAMQSAQGARIAAAPVAIDSEEPARIAELAKGKARYVLDVRTLMWQMGYFPTDWTHYRVFYTAKARLIDVDTKNVIAEAFCKQLPESNVGAPTFDELLAMNAARLKATNAANAEACADSIGRDMLALQGPIRLPSAAVATAEPAQAPTQPQMQPQMQAPVPTPAQSQVAANGSWQGVMACDARSDSGARAQAYEAKFAVEVQGNTVTVQRRTTEVEESLSGQVANGQLELQGSGHRVGEPARPWRLAVSGAFPEGATRYHGKGAMTANGRQLRKCELSLTRM